MFYKTEKEKTMGKFTKQFFFLIINDKQQQSNDT